MPSFSGSTPRSRDSGFGIEGSGSRALNHAIFEFNPKEATIKAARCRQFGPTLSQVWAPLGCSGLLFWATWPSKPTTSSHAPGVCLRGDGWGDHEPREVSSSPGTVTFSCSNIHSNRSWRRLPSNCTCSSLARAARYHSISFQL